MSPYLSLVATSRNDEHGGNTLYRTQIFVDSFLDQCRKHQLPAELILVEWNPPPDRKPLAEVIRWSQQNEWVTCRVITVPYERHVMIHYGRVLPLFQMIAKNVGIRRARGEFVLATNIDIILSDELASFVASRGLKRDRTYRCDRFDVDSRIPDTIPLDEKLRFAWSNVVRRNRRMQPPELVELQNQEAPVERLAEWMQASGHWDVETDGGVQAVVARDTIPSQWLHLDACGDFTMLHRDGWSAIGGYPEIETFSLHLDSLGLNCAHWAGFRETALLPPAVCFHVEHAIGSGYAKEHAESLFSRLEKQGIGWLDYEFVEPLLDEMHESKAAIDFNTDAWGMRDIPLDETTCNKDKLIPRLIAQEERADQTAPVTAVRPRFNSDRRYTAIFRQELERQRGYVLSLQAARLELTRGMESYRQAYENSREQLQRISETHAEALRTIEEFRMKIANTRSRLSKYQRFFGWLERAGFLR
jgi:hypothetical protein